MIYEYNGMQYLVIRAGGMRCHRPGVAIGGL